jgi:hypothetical protein
MKDFKNCAKHIKVFFKNFFLEISQQGKKG